MSPISPLNFTGQQTDDDDDWVDLADAGSPDVHYTSGNEDVVSLQTLSSEFVLTRMFLLCSLPTWCYACLHNIGQTSLVEYPKTTDAAINSDTETTQDKNQDSGKMAVTDKEEFATAPTAAVGVEFESNDGASKDDESSVNTKEANELSLVCPSSQYLSLIHI